MMFAAALGWDVGAWHCQRGASRDALVLITDEGGALRVVGKPWRGNLREDFNGGHGPVLLDKLMERVGSSADGPVQLYLGIDTPLGWPDSFRLLLDGTATIPVSKTKAGNSYLLRDTDKWLWEQGHRPLSPVQDLIGSQSTKGLAVLASLGLRRKRAGEWKGKVGRTYVTAIEAYPSPCAHSAWYRTISAPLLEQLGDANPDIVDALACAIVAWTHTMEPEHLAAPNRRGNKREGWIWVPRDCLKDERSS